MKRIICLALLLAMLFGVVAYVGACDVQPNNPQTKPSDPTQKPTDNPEFELSELKFGDEISAANDNFYKKYSAEEKQLYYELWDADSRVGLKIDISASELYAIELAYRNYSSTGNSTQSDVYRKCNLTVTVNGVDYYFEEVGVRMRGNTSRRSFCDESGKIFDYVHLRFSFNETFDEGEYAEGGCAHELFHDWSGDEEGREARDDRTFATMKKMYYKWNKNYDQSYVREIFCNETFAACGVLAPHITLTQIQIKQGQQFENLGVGTLYETVDKQFIKRNFAKEYTGGDLYKCTYPANLTSIDGRGVETPTQRFTYSLKTNDDRTAEDYNHHKYLIALIETLKSAKTTDEDFREKIEKVVDMDHFARFEAVNYLMGNPDCIRNNSNNYYIYFTPQGVAYLIPYDYDRCLGINVDWNPTGNGCTTLLPYSTKAAVGNTVNPLYTKTILNGGLPYYKQLYKSKLTTLLGSDYFTTSSFESLYNHYKANYKRVAMPSAAIIDQCKNLRAAALSFSLEGTAALSGTDGNIAATRYIELKRDLALKNL